MYRPLNHNEKVIVNQAIYVERGLTGGLAESMFVAYTAKAMAMDEPEFTIFQESEIERKARNVETQCKKSSSINSRSELTPIEFLNYLECLSKSDAPNKEPKNCFEWFYCDEHLLDIRHKRLRVKFFNSLKYRKQILHRYLEDGIIQESHLKDTLLIGKLIGEFHRKYPGTRQGTISYFEILFGDPTNFCYNTAMEREAFHFDPVFRVELLKKLNLRIDLPLNQIREQLEKSALESGAVTFEQVAEWKEIMTQT